MVAFEAIVRPALRRMLGAEAIARPQVTAAIAGDVRSPVGVRDFLHVRVAHDGARWVATPTASPGALRLTAIAAANGLAVLPEEWTDVPAGSGVTVWLLERRGA
jgi:molybdopterin molybdotransferase